MTGAAVLDVKSCGRSVEVCYERTDGGRALMTERNIHIAPPPCVQGRRTARVQRQLRRQHFRAAAPHDADVLGGLSALQRCASLDSATLQPSFSFLGHDKKATSLCRPSYTPGPTYTLAVSVGCTLSMRPR